jgi:hypothetical protein
MEQRIERSVVDAAVEAKPAQQAPPPEVAVRLMHRDPEQPGL